MFQLKIWFIIIIQLGNNHIKIRSLLTTEKLNLQLTDPFSKVKKLLKCEPIYPPLSSYTPEKVRKLRDTIDEDEFYIAFVWNKKLTEKK